MPDNLELALQVGLADADPEELDLATRRLRAELQDLPIDSVSLVAAERPTGAKAGDAITLGALTVSLAPVVIPALVEFLKSWMARKEGRSVVLRRKGDDRDTEIEIKAPISEATISALVEQLSAKSRPRRKRR